MSMSKSKAEKLVRELNGLISREFYNGGTFTCFGMNISDNVRVDNDANVNGGLYPNGGDLGVEVSRGLLALSNDTAIKFGIAHELGHAFSSTLLARLNLNNLSGPATEVVADLGSAYILHETGVSWRKITNAARDGVQVGIFDLNWSGDHPPGAERAYYVEQLASRMEGGDSFNTAAAAILNSVPAVSGSGGAILQPGPKIHGGWCRFKTKIKNAIPGFG